ncbi:ABC transporter permease [Mesorhizobium tianshanense]|uniref:Peptide/nickel transport system permease protein n=1 Tax=Mesorhizobium tianshanense TaxID=39844 RepID=A0A562MH09_9HYPH|nr:ABC transporter permease [Mesorhizobium tianshanense]TWI19179.1 peptide/nickel transport system permease protein [Mesorhizobium tianshanense]GLS36553.1 ABC transporter permease [Mesorhizobium tianshanense]
MKEQAATDPIGRRTTFASTRRLPSLVIAGAISFLLVAVMSGALADILAPQGYNDQNLLIRLKPPSFLGGPHGYYFGTDELGRDVFSRVLFSLRFSLLIAVTGTLVGAGFGTLLGFLAAHFQGLWEDILSALVDFQASIPFMIFALAALAFFGNSIFLFVILLGLYGWEVYARLVRGLVLSAKELGYVEALRNLGFHPIRIYSRHVLPNIGGALLVQITLNFPGIILLESGLSFLGLGIQPPLTSLGLMIGSGREFMTTAWWTAVAPGTVIFLTALSVTLVGDWFRDRLDAMPSN